MTMTTTAKSDSSRSAPVDAASARSLPEEAAAPVLGLSESGKIRPCPSGVNPNCVSTSSATSPIASAPVIRAPVKSLEDLAAELTFIVLSVESSARVTSSKRIGDMYYLQFSCKGMYGSDTLEFLINSSGVTDRNWEGDLPGPIVTYRSVGGGVKYIYPFQTPLTDFGAQKKRLSAIRNRLKWNILGCELVECYE